MAYLTNFSPSIEGFENTSRFDVSFDFGTANRDGHQPTADFTFDDFLVPAAIESYSKEENQNVQPYGDVMSLESLSSSLSTRSDLGACFDRSRTKQRGVVPRARGTENSWGPSR